MVDDLGVHVLGNLAGEAHSYSDDLSSVQTREVAEDGIGTVVILATYTIDMNKIQAYLGLFKMSARIRTS